MSQNNTINLSIEVDDRTQQGISQAQSNINELRNSTVSIDLDADASAARSEIQELERNDVTVDVDADVSAARSEIESLSNINIGVGGSGGITQALGGLTRGAGASALALGPVGIALSAVSVAAVAAGVALSAYAESSEQLAVIDALLIKTGRSAAFSTVEMERLALSTGAPIEQFRIGMIGLIQAQELSSAEIKELIGLIGVLSKASDDFDFGDIKDFGKMFQTADGIVAELTSVNGQLAFMSEAAMDAAVQFAEMGDVASAKKIIFEELRDAAAGINIEDPIKEIRNIGKSFQFAQEKMGEFIATEIEPFAKTINSVLSVFNDLLSQTENEKFIEAQQDLIEAKIELAERALKGPQKLFGIINTESKLENNARMQELRDIIELGEKAIPKLMDRATAERFGKPLEEVIVKRFSVDTFRQKEQIENLEDLRSKMARAGGALDDPITQIMNKMQSNVQGLIKSASEIIDKGKELALTSGVASKGSEGKPRKRTKAERLQFDIRLKSEREFIEEVKDLRKDELKDRLADDLSLNDDQARLIKSLIVVRRDAADDIANIHKSRNDKILLEEERLQKERDDILRRGVDDFARDASAEASRIRIKVKIEAEEGQVIEELRLKTLPVLTSKQEINVELDETTTSQLELNRAERMAKLSQLDSVNIEDPEVAAIDRIHNLRIQSIEEIGRMSEIELKKRLLGEEALTTNESNQINQRLSILNEASDEKIRLAERERNIRIQEGAVFEAWAIESASSLSLMSKDIGDGITRSLGSSISEAFFTGAKGADIFKQSMIGLGQSVVAQLITITAQKIIASVTSNALTVKDTLVSTSALATNTGAILASNALVAGSSGPAGSLLALATGGVSAGTAATAYKAALVSMTALNTGVQSASLSGVAHGGLTNVPKETTFLLDKGERVLSPRQNEDLTGFLSNPKSQGGSGAIIINFNVSAVDATGVKQLLARNIPFIAGQIQQANSQRSRRNG